MTNHFIENALSNGPAGKQWLEAIPSLLSLYAAKWSLEILPPFDLNYNYVAPVLRKNGIPAVIKIGFPQDPEFQTEIRALTIFNGEGMAQLLEVDAENSIILIEQVNPGQPLSTLQDDDQATKILAQVMQKLWKPLPPNHGFITLEEWSSAIPELRKQFQGTTGPIPTYLIDTAEQVFPKLINSADTLVLVHGDLHHDNVLASDRVGWLAIDPKGIAAEPAYEVAAMIRNPYEKLKDMSNHELESLLRRRIQILSAELKLNPTRIYQWCLVQTILSAVWNVGTSKGPEHATRVAEVLVRMKLF